jgi:hypothetical protein
MLWQAAAGKRRWKGIENTELLRRLHEGKVCDSPDASSNGLPTTVDPVVLKAIAADPDERYGSASEFRSALEALLKELGAPPTPADLARFMTTEFRAERAHAAEVMSARLQELDGAPVPATTPKNQAIISASQMSSFGPVSEPKADAANIGSASLQPKAMTTRNDARAGQAANSVKGAEKVSTGRRGPAAQDDSIVGSKRVCRRSPLALGLLGLAIAAVPTFLAIRHGAFLQRSEVAVGGRTTGIVPTTSTVAAATTEANVNLAPITDPTPSLTAVSSAPLDLSLSAAPHPHRRGGHHVGGPAPVEAAPRVPPPVVASPAAIPVAASAPSATSSAEHPSLDKQNPWGTHSGPVDRSDPWTGSSAAAPHRADPWTP